MAINGNIEISEGIKKMVEIRLKEELDMEINKALKIFNERKGEIVAGVIVDLMKMTEMEFHKDRLVFTIRTPEEKK